jgi:hypothetical protein
MSPDQMPTKDHELYQKQINKLFKRLLEIDEIQDKLEQESEEIWMKIQELRQA